MRQLTDSPLCQGPVCLTCDLSPCQEDGEVFVEDYSNNGTFVDGILIGKDKKLPLVNNAVLSLAEQRNKGQRHNPGSKVNILGEGVDKHTVLNLSLSPVFVFIDLMSDDQSSLPKELQEKYLLTRRIGT